MSLVENGLVIARLSSEVWRDQICILEASPWCEGVESVGGRQGEEKGGHMLRGWCRGSEDR